MKKKIQKILFFLIAFAIAFGFSSAAPKIASAATATVANETALRSQVDKGGTAKLSKDIALSQMLVIPSGKTLTIDLNGKVLSREMTTEEMTTEVSEDGSVIRVEEGGTLIVTDTTRTDSGVITGGWSELGGGICNYGTTTLSGGTIKGNTAKDPLAMFGLIMYGFGGGIYNAEGATLTLAGGIISGNNARTGGGVYNSYGATLIIEDGNYTKQEGATTKKIVAGTVITGNEAATDTCGIYNAGTMSLSGKAELSGNADGKDIYLPFGATFTCGKLTYTKPVGLDAADNNHVATAGFSANNEGKAEQYFFAVRPEIYLWLNDTAPKGEIELHKDAYTIVEVYQDGKLTQTMSYDSPGKAWTESQKYWTPCWYYFDHPETRKAAEELKKNYPSYYSGSGDWGHFYDDLRGIGGLAEQILEIGSSTTEEQYLAASYDLWDGHLQDDYQVKIILGSDWSFSERQLIWRFRNIVIDLNGHTIRQDRNGKKSDKGYFFYLEDFAKLTILDSNPTSDGYGGIKGGVITGGRGDDVGGGFIINDYGELNILGGTIYDCTTDEHGGAIYANDPRAVINLKDCTFYACKTIDSGDDCNGGAIYLKHTMRTTMENVTFKYCYSEDNGGAIYIGNRPGTVRMKNCTFTNNRALDYGGVIAIGDIDNKKGFLFEAVNCSFTQNQCGKDGGVVCVSDNDDSVFHYPILFTDCSFTNNTAGRDGSVFELDDNSVCLNNCTVTNNTASHLGAIYVNDNRKVSVAGKTVIKDNKGQHVILDDNGDKTRVHAAGLTEGSYIIVNAIGGDNTILMKDVDERQVKYFHTEYGHTLEFRKTGTREAAMTVATLYGEGLIWVVAGIAAAVVLAGVTIVLVKKKKRKEAAGE